METVQCHCFYCENNRIHPSRHEGKFERKSNVSSDTLEPGEAVEFCTVCGHERLMKGGDLDRR